MLVGFGVSLWSYLSPVAYDMFSRDRLGDPTTILYKLYMLNPATPIINFFRYAYLGIGNIDWLFYGISWVFTIAAAAIAVLLFGRIERNFMDTI